MNRRAWALAQVYNALNSIVILAKALGHPHKGVIPAKAGIHRRVSTRHKNQQTCNSAFVAPFGLISPQTRLKMDSRFRGNDEGIWVGVFALLLLLFSTPAFADCGTPPFSAVTDGIVRLATPSGMGPANIIGTGTSGIAGDVTYDATNKTLAVCNGTSWLSLTSGFTASGTASYVPRWSSSTTLTSSLLYDSGAAMAVGTTSTGSLFNINGSVSIGTAYVATAAPTDGLIVVGSTGIGTAAPTAQLTVNGTSAYQFGTDYATTGTQTAVAIGTSATSVRYTGTAEATFQGIANGVNGRVLYLHNGSSYTLTLANKSASETTYANQIVTGTDSDLSVAANSAVTLQYDGAATNSAGATGAWRVIGGAAGSGSEPKTSGVTIGGTCAGEGSLGYDTSSHVPVFCSSSGVWTGLWNNVDLSFTAQTNLVTSIVVTASAMPTWLGGQALTATLDSCTGTSCGVSCNGGSYATSCSLTTGQTLTVKQTTSSSAATTTTATVTLANKTAIFSATTNSCPSGYIPVPAYTLPSGTTVPAFCVMRYEAQNGGSGIAASVAGGTPYVNVTWQQAVTSCGAAGSTLISENQWLSIAHQVTEVASNWSGGAVGSGYLYSGHNDNSPASALAAPSDPTATCYTGTGNTSPSNQCRTQTLPNGAILWDIAGNVWEWVNETIAIASRYAGGASQWMAYHSNDGVAAIGDALMPLDKQPPSTWNANQGMGRYYDGYSTAGAYNSINEAPDYVTGYAAPIAAFVRGGSWSSAAGAGVFALSLGNGRSYASTNIGFRCTR